MSQEAVQDGLGHGAELNENKKLVSEKALEKNPGDLSPADNVMIWAEPQRLQERPNDWSETSRRALHRQFLVRFGLEVQMNKAVIREGLHYGMAPFLLQDAGVYCYTKTCQQLLDLRWNEGS